ncbi:MAG: disulfide bond formation protein B [Burkholderiaceae bacterium]
MTAGHLYARLGTFDATVLTGIGAMLAGAFYFQLAMGELPCALCYLIRICLLLFSVGLLLNLNFGTNPWNYCLSAVSALIGSLISLAFMFISAYPGALPTGSAIFGLHMYTWTFITFTALIFYCVGSLATCALTGHKGPEQDARRPKTKFQRYAAALVLAMAAANLVSVTLQHGINPFGGWGQTEYFLLK